MHVLRPSSFTEQFSEFPDGRVSFGERRQFGEGGGAADVFRERTEDESAELTGEPGGATGREGGV